MDALPRHPRAHLLPRSWEKARGGTGAMTSSNERFTLVSFHAHPDDEALLTGGLLARAAAEGHRVVLVTATAGERGLTDDRDDRDGQDGQPLAAQRAAELAASAKILGAARVVVLG